MIFDDNSKIIFVKPMLWVLIRIAEALGDSNEHLQHRFLIKNKQNCHLIIIK